MASDKSNNNNANTGADAKATASDPASSPGKEDRNLPKCGEKSTRNAVRQAIAAVLTRADGKLRGPPPCREPGPRSSIDKSTGVSSHSEHASEDYSMAKKNRPDKKDKPPSKGNKKFSTSEEEWEFVRQFVDRS